MTAPAAAAGADKEVDAAAADKNARPAKMPLEKPGAFAGEAGPSMPPPKPSRVEKAIKNLSKAYVPDADVLLSHEQLEEQRLYVLDQAEKVATPSENSTEPCVSTIQLIVLLLFLGSRVE